MNKQQVLAIALIVSSFQFSHARFETPAKITGIGFFTAGLYQCITSIQDYVDGKYAISDEEFEDSALNPFIKRSSFKKDMALGAAEVAAGVCMFNAPRFFAAKVTEKKKEKESKSSSGDDEGYVSDASQASNASLSAFELLHNDGVEGLLGKDSKDFLYAEIAGETIKRDHLDISKLKTGHQVSWRMFNTEGKETTGTAKYKKFDKTFELSTALQDYASRNGLGVDVTIGGETTL